MRNERQARAETRRAGAGVGLLGWLGWLGEGWFDRGEGLVQRRRRVGARRQRGQLVGGRRLVGPRTVGLVAVPFERDVADGVPVLALVLRAVGARVGGGAGGASLVFAMSSLPSPAPAPAAAPKGLSGPCPNHARPFCVVHLPVGGAVVVPGFAPLPVNLLLAKLHILPAVVIALVVVIVVYLIVVVVIELLLRAAVVGRAALFLILLILLVTLLRRRRCGSGSGRRRLLTLRSPLHRSSGRASAGCEKNARRRSRRPGPPDTHSARAGPARPPSACAPPLVCFTSSHHRCSP